MARPQAVRGGNAFRVRLDDATRTRIAWCAHIAAERLQCDGLSISAIVRRAVQRYAEHMEDLMDEPMEGLQDYRERCRIRDACKGQVFPITRTEACTTPTRKLSAIVKAAKAAKPTPGAKLAARLAEDFEDGMEATYE